MFPQRFLGPVYDEAAIWPNTDWWRNFNDAELSAFIDEVKASNLDLANNRRNLEAAQLTLREAGLARWPDPAGDVGRRHWVLVDAHRREHYLVRRRRRAHAAHGVVQLQQHLDEARRVRTRPDGL